MERLRKKKKLRKNVLPTSSVEISITMQDMEEDPEDTIPLSQRTRAARAVVGKKRKSQSPPSPMREEHPI